MNREYHIINEDARIALRRFKGQADLIVTSPPYADARKRHYDSIDPDDYAAWFASFHEPLAAALKTNGSLVINIKDKIVGGVIPREFIKPVEAGIRGRDPIALDGKLGKLAAGVHAVRLTQRYAARRPAPPAHRPAFHGRAA